MRMTLRLAMVVVLAVLGAGARAQVPQPGAAADPAQQQAPVSTTTVEEQVAAALERFRTRAWALIDEAKEGTGYSVDVRSVREQTFVADLASRLESAIRPVLEGLASAGGLTPDSAKEAIAGERTVLLDELRDAITAWLRGVAPPPKRDEFDSDHEYFVELVRYTLFEQNRVSDWLMLLIAIGAGVALGWMAGVALRLIGARVRDKRRGRIAGESMAAIARPVNLVVILTGVSLGLAAIAMPSATRRAFSVAMYVAWIVPMFWIAWNLCDVATASIGRLTKRTESTLDDQLVPLLRKTLRIFVVILFSLFVANNVLGANIAGFLAGFGIAGLAVSLAAQDSLKNLFGSITIFADKPFYLGDIVDFNGMVGTVEQIGFRSTRLRTFEGHLITVPNSQLVNESVKNISGRPSIRFRFSIGVTYDTPPEKLREGIEILKEIFASAPGQRVDRPHYAVFEKFNAYSLDIMCQWHFHPADFWMAMEAASEINAQILERFNAAGIEFAFPTRTLLLASDDSRGLRVSAAPEGDRGGA